MREYILTEREREVIRAFLKSGVTNDAVYLLRHRAKNAQAKLKEDLLLVEELLAKETP
jgi:hypothetical protein